MGNERQVGNKDGCTLNLLPNRVEDWRRSGHVPCVFVYLQLLSGGLVYFDFLRNLLHCGLQRSFDYVPTFAGRPVGLP
jgi:hypothetical protein